MSTPGGTPGTPIPPNTAPYPRGSTYTPPWWVDPLIDAGMAVAGGAYSNYQNNKKAKQEYLNKKEFAQMGIRWRVEDAKAAGLHPLFALGAQLPTYSPSFAMDSMGPALASAGQSFGRAISAQATSAEKAAQALGLKLLESQIHETDARAILARAEAMRALRERGGSTFPPTNMSEADLIGEAASTSGGAELVAPKVSMSRPGNSAVVAGPSNPSLREYTLSDGMKVMLPAANDLGEALEPLSESWALAWGVYKENERIYGQQWAREFIRRYQPQWINNIDDKLRARYLYGGESRRGRYRKTLSDVKERYKQYLVR